MSKNKKKTFCGSLNAIKLFIVLPGEPPGCFDVAASFSFHALGRHPSPFCEHPYSILYFQPSSSQSDLQIFLGFLTASTTDLRGNLLPQSHNIRSFGDLDGSKGNPSRIFLFSSSTSAVLSLTVSISPEAATRGGLWEKACTPATLLKNRLWHRCFPVNFA